MKTPIAAGILLVLALSAGSVQSWRQSDSRSEKIKVCTERTGLKEREISSVTLRNQGCAMDCILNSGLIASVVEEYKAPCGSEHHCVLDRCVARSEDIDEESQHFWVPEIRILEANLPDTDMTPTTGDTDAFVTVEMGSRSERFFEHSDIMCSTPVVLNNLRPRWNYACKPGPMKKSARLIFRVTDSDTPSAGVESVGHAMVTLGELLDKGTQKLYLTLTEFGVSQVYYLKVAVTGRSYLY